MRVVRFLTYFGIILFIRFMMRVYLRSLQVRGTENVPKSGPLIVVANHLNNADPPVIAATIRRRLIFMAKEEMFHWPVLGILFHLFGAFPVRRFEADVAALRKAARLVRQGNALLMFPEGTRSRDARLHKAYPGTAFLALFTGAPVLPVAITGTQKASWPWLFVKWFTGPRVTVTFGKPFRLPQQKPTEEAVRQASEHIMRQIAELLPEEYRGDYASAASSPAAPDRPAAEHEHV